jgi:hypothetical protein
MTLAKVSRVWEIDASSHRNTLPRYKNIPVPVARNGDCALLLLDLNQQPFDYWSGMLRSYAFGLRSKCQRPTILSRGSRRG